LGSERARRGVTITASIRSIAMLIGLMILVALTFIAIGEVRKTQGNHLKSKD
jgi:hypothetical protein